MSQILFNIFPALLYLGIFVTVMLQLNWKMAVVVFCFVPLPAALAGVVQRHRPEQLAYGRPEATLTEITAAAKAANAHQFIELLPDGYETLVGERGGRLSVGEKQRVAIARALLKNPPILVFDEAYVFLDAESEVLVQQALERLMSGCPPSFAQTKFWCSKPERSASAGRTTT